jgi:hypothetical protein
MKQIIQIIANFFILINHFTWSLLLWLWYGKLNKVSPYHSTNTKLKQPYGKDYMNEFFQRDIYPVSVEKKKEVADEILNRLINHPHFSLYFSALEMPVYNKRFQRYGTQTVESVLEDMFNDISNNLTETTNEN